MGYREMDGGVDTKKEEAGNGIRLKQKLNSLCKMLKSILSGDIKRPWHEQNRTAETVLIPHDRVWQSLSYHAWFPLVSRGGINWVLGGKASMFWIWCLRLRGCGPEASHLLSKAKCFQEQCRKNSQYSYCSWILTDLDTHVMSRM